ncbi:hypothetical protein AS188_06910 [Kocuria flava]|uniref:Heparan-alpha-glucosaminide N-acetyltransferase catalytic domain-containing protein n=1 Tax=Kocuria flava TaxID=446860 RepID=A0A0U3HED7_9MICC|nr:heparan-alpha-glucosaminide N-acetyltransferase domain-containing protein [Kocuria flava]ALU39529.1 hypothetical protein AS188_06910 [Kocuria flava]GEO91910.1 hypothetical protein KFL01_12160 [Kocuria flava]
MSSIEDHRTGAPAADGTAGRSGRRLVGVDAARGLALVGLIAVHILPAWDPADDGATLQWTLFSGQSAALFALLAGVGLAFTTGGRTPHRGRRLAADRAGIVVRALLVAVTGLLINGLMPEDPPAYGILLYYGMFFLLALPFLHLGARALLGWAAGTAVAGPVALHVLGPLLPAPDTVSPTLVDVLTAPGTVLAQVLLTGTYPALVYLAYLLAGLGLGRLNLSALRVQTGMLLGGAALAVTAWCTYWVAVIAGGGYDRILAATPWLDAWQLDEIIVWGPGDTLPTTTWWWLLIPGPHANTPVSVLQDLGIAVAALGGMLLVARRAGAWLAPLAAMGAMTLTLYSAHLLALIPELHVDRPEAWFTAHVVLAALFALAWGNAFGRGPLERVVARGAGAARGAWLRRGTGAAG